jgi:glycosyltransferase involved in cell wall biosynthesis
MMDKILILANDSGGLFHFRGELIQRLSENFEVICGVPNDEFEHELESVGGKCLLIPFNRTGTNPIKDIALLYTYHKHIKSLRPKYVLTYTIKPNIYGGIACRLSNTPYIANITGLGNAVEKKNPLQPILLLMLKLGLKGARKVFFQNVANERFLSTKGIITGSHEIIPGSGVNLEKFALMEYPRNEVINFSFFGRMIKEKGIEQYLDAAEAIHQKYHNTLFHICGNPTENYINRVKELEKRGIVHYHGMVRDVREVHQYSDCTVHPTFYPEGMSNVLLESCACGRPIITTDRPGCREIVVDGVNGFLINERDSEDLIDKIGKFMALSWEQKKEMGTAGRKKVEAEFDRKIVIDRYLKEIQIN